MIHNVYIIENEAFGTRAQAKAYCGENEISEREIIHRYAEDCGGPTFIARKKDTEIEPGTEVFTDYLEAVKVSLEMTDGETVVWCGETKQTAEGIVTA